MPSQLKITNKDYYDNFPDGLHSTGDIWCDLPAFGLFDLKAIRGIVITPACDLAQRKCETVTYLPILSVEEYMALPAFYIETWKAISEVLCKVRQQDAVVSPGRYELPILSEVADAVAAAKQAKSQAVHIERLEEYLRYAKQREEKGRTTVQQIEKIITKKEVGKLLESVVRNAYRPDVHFLPTDGQPFESSAVPQNSLVLFRYPMTVPIEALDAAQCCDESSWMAIRDKAVSWEIRSHMVAWPIKLGRLKDDFLSDLLSRYVAMYIRLGSRDFTEETVEYYVAQIQEGA